MDISNDVAKAKKDEAAVVGAVDADASGLKSIWAASKPAVITVAIVFLFIGFAFGRCLPH